MRALIFSSVPRGEDQRAAEGVRCVCVGEIFFFPVYSSDEEGGEVTEMDVRVRELRTEDQIPDRQRRV